MEGYNIAFKLQSKTLAGRTEDNLNISAVTKESLTKDDQGEAKVSVTGHEVTFRATGLVDLNSGTGANANTIGRDAIVALALAKGSSAVIPFVYQVSGGASYTGNCIITSYGETSNASDEATWSIDCRVSGEMTLQS